MSSFSLAIPEECSRSRERGAKRSGAKFLLARGAPIAPEEEPDIFYQTPDLF